MKTKQEIIKETAEFYNLTNRGYKERKGCLYLTEDGKKCAIGRCISDDKLHWFSLRFSAGIMDVSGSFVEGETLDDYLQPEYQGHDLSFWSCLQEFHDDENNWDDTGMCNDGVIQYNSLMSKEW